jgi:hypothetical protein
MRTQKKPFVFYNCMSQLFHLLWHQSVLVLPLIEYVSHNKCGVCTRECAENMRQETRRLLGKPRRRVINEKPASFIVKTRSIVIHRRIKYKGVNFERNWGCNFNLFLNKMWVAFWQTLLRNCWRVLLMTPGVWYAIFCALVW